VHLEISNLVHRLTIASSTLPMKSLPGKGHGQGQVIGDFRFVNELAMWSISLVMTGCPLSGCDQGHMSNFYIVDSENFATASRWRSACGLHVRRGWTPKFIIMLVDCNPLTPLLRFIVDLSYKLFLQCYAAVGKNSTDTLRHAVCLRWDSSCYERYRRGAPQNCPFPHLLHCSS